MQTILNLPEQQVVQLTKLSQERQVSPDEIVSFALSEYLHAQDETAIDRVFGLWADRNEDGLAYQERLRSEWDQR